MAATATQQERPLRKREKRVLALLGLPTLTLALAITVVTARTYVPKLASRFTGSTTVIGLIVGAEGFLALWVPLIAGAAISLLKGPLSSTHGYAGMWLVRAASVLVSIPLVGQVRAED